MSFDVIVVGAGPAGSTAARELAASGARVIVVDRAEFPRYKACGGGIPLRTERFLPFPITPVIEETIDRIDVTYGGRWRFTRDSGAPFAHMVMRDRFDALLLAEAQKAGAEFRPATTIRALDLRPGRATVQADGFEASAPLLICADGAHSPVGRMAGLGGDLQECAAWEVEVEAGERVHQFHTRSLIELGYRPWGYAWIFPKEQLLSFGVVLPRDQANTMKEHVSRFLDRYGLADAPVRIARGHKIRFRRAEERIAEGNVLLAGDAAGLADEFTQEGIFYAISSGRIAARSALQALATSGDLAPYQRAVDAEIQPELRGARLIAFMFYGMLRRLPRPWMWASGHTGYLWDAFFAVQRGESTYAREVARVPLLPWAAAKLLDRG
ncbi:MAG: geranylgeranyl reductase family protein [Dehalococcoidia bacterium]